MVRQVREQILYSCPVQTGTLPEQGCVASRQNRWRQLLAGTACPCETLQPYTNHNLVIINQKEIQYRNSREKHLKIVTRDRYFFITSLVVPFPLPVGYLENKYTYIHDDTIY